MLLVLASSFIVNPNDKIKLDGIISKDEWAGAEEHDLSSGGKLYIIRQAGTLYIGIKGNAQGWAHVYLHWKDSVKVLHASAALGDLLYVQEKESWNRKNKFNWEVRERVYDETLMRKQEAYFNKNGWCANNSNTGDKTTLEFKIDLERYGNTELRIAALHTVDAKSLSAFPAGLNDDTLLKELVSGAGPDNVYFKPGAWEKIK
jgi:hypothetical protein